MVSLPTADMYVDLSVTVGHLAYCDLPTISHLSLLIVPLIHPHCHFCYLSCFGRVSTTAFSSVTLSMSQMPPSL